MRESTEISRVSSRASMATI